ncbi:TPA: SHOCT domain-containing protein [Aeromonas veronii]|nr:SHOCT domain-containing protein [Aeromonas veronii]HDO1333876.1 SHOCT domain-containing protein [Aeromonas veronii]HDO1336458.1 SHOCT domain-containing protein [Aeromonas veronii]HDO1337574.1 SHOCT domain-containing protein [Aeromonas veronii]HDO1340977.1 SHOCT domain-containing protein [Aeromonas veronii]
MSAEEISGKCPLCHKKTIFREFSFTENLTNIGSFIGGFISGGLSGKIKNASVLSNSISDSREFPNYKCGCCGGAVMQCSVCDEIIPYEHDGSSHVCGVNDFEQATSTSQKENDDLISKLERLASLKEKGFITEKEFEEQKNKILS